MLWLSGNPRVMEPRCGLHAYFFFFSQRWLIHVDAEAFLRFRNKREQLSLTTRSRENVSTTHPMHLNATFTVQTTGSPEELLESVIIIFWSCRTSLISTKSEESTTEWRSAGLHSNISISTRESAGLS